MSKLGKILEAINWIGPGAGLAQSGEWHPLTKGEVKALRKAGFTVHHGTSHIDPGDGLEYWKVAPPKNSNGLGGNDGKVRGLGRG